MEKLKWPLFFLIILAIILFLPQNSNTYTTTTQKKEMDRYFQKEEENSDLFAILEIPSINVKQPIYQKESENNQVDKNVTLIDYKREEANFSIVLAAHSGNGIHSYFTNLNQLQTGDIIKLYIHNQTFEFLYLKKEEVKKTGTVEIKDYNFTYLVLITCSESKKDIQEIYYAKLI